MLVAIANVSIQIIKKKTHSYLFMALFFIIIIRHFPSNLSPFYWNHPRLKKKIIIIILFQDFSPWAALKKETNNNNKPLRSCSKHEIVVPGKQRVRVPPSRKRKALNKDECFEIFFTSLRIEEETIEGDLTYRWWWERNELSKNKTCGDSLAIGFNDDWE